LGSAAERENSSTRDGWRQILAVSRREDGKWLEPQAAEYRERVRRAERPVVVMKCL
jgi:hypothetical protein